jgi:hypothetical protein
MPVLLKSTLLRGMLGFVQVMTIVVMAAAVQRWLRPLSNQFLDPGCSVTQAELAGEAKDIGEKRRSNEAYAVGVGRKAHSI